MQTSKPERTARQTIGFVSLGCPKATVDSERILTQLRIEGYEMVGGYEDADLVIVNTCGFIDEAIEESLEAIDEALEQNGRVIVTGCLGAKAELLTQNFPDLLAITGPHDYQAVMNAVHRALPPAHDPIDRSGAAARASPDTESTLPTSRSPKAATTNAAFASFRACAVVCAAGRSAMCCARLAA